MFVSPLSHALLKWQFSVQYSFFIHYNRYQVFEKEKANFLIIPCWHWTLITDVTVYCMHMFWVSNAWRDLWPTQRYSARFSLICLSLAVLTICQDQVAALVMQLLTVIYGSDPTSSKSGVDDCDFGQRRGKIIKLQYAVVCACAAKLCMLQPGAQFSCYTQVYHGTIVSELRQCNLWNL